MFRPMTTLALAFSVTLCAEAADAEEVYQFRLNRGIYAVAITPGCDIDGRYTLTGAVIRTPNIMVGEPTDIAAITWAQSTLTVCTRFGDVAQEAAPLPLSTDLLRNPDLMAIGETVRFGVDPSPVADMFHGVNPPDIAEVQRRSATTLVFRYYDSITGDLILGPITYELAEPGRLQSTPGFDPAHHLPISVLRIVYPIDWLFVDYDEEFFLRIEAFGTY